MRSKPILLTMLFSVTILVMSMINVNLYSILPLKATYHSLTKEAQKQVTCLADNIYFEAAQEPLDGKKAVAFVTINRVLSGNYANDICGVVYQKVGNICQFSWNCEKKGLTIRDTKLYNEIRELATNIIVNFEKMTDVTNGATYYHADYVNPKWKLEKIETIGRHIFYKKRSDKIDRNREFY